jgi:nucleoside-diphosphate-sugar epimerase
VEPRPGDVLRLIADSTAAERALKYSPAISLADGIADLVNSFSAMPAQRLRDLASRVVIKNWQ